MSWGYFDDATPSHPKLIRAGAEAAWLWFSSVAYSNNHRLDGRIAKDLLPVLYAPLAAKAAKLAKRLCECGLWHDRGDHYEIHDYADYQQRALKAEQEGRRRYERERKRTQRAGHVPDNVRDNSGTVPVGQDHAVPAVTRGDPDPYPDPYPREREITGARTETSGAHNLEVREGWAEAYQQAGAGVPPRPTGQQFTQAVEFARDVARTHSVPLREAAAAIARAGLELPRDKRVWALTSLDPFARETPPGGPGNGLDPSMRV